MVASRVAAGTVVAAIAMPFFGDVLSLIGASQDSLSGCILPTWFFLELFWRRAPDAKVCAVAGPVAIVHG
jgi:hypothetical protein